MTRNPRNPSSHVLVADGRAGLVLLKPVTVAIAVAVDPVQAAFGSRQVPFDQCVAGGTPGGMQRDQVKRRGVGRAVIRRMRDQLEMRQLAIAQLMQDLARFSIAIVVALRRLNARPARPVNRGQIPDRPASFCNETIRLSRPNNAMNQGRPAAGTNTIWSVPSIGSRRPPCPQCPGSRIGKILRCCIESSAPCVASLDRSSVLCGSI